MASTTTPSPVERLDDPDLEAALDEVDHESGDDADEVFAAIDEMIHAIRKAVA